MSINDVSQDLLTGVDFTGLPSAGPADLNNGIDLTVPLKTGADETIGRAIILTTTDTALNTPDVPNPAISASYTKFKRYQWNRRPFAGAVNKGIQVYQWNDDAVTDAILLKWLPQFVDTTAIAATANNALASANNAVTIANNATTIAGTANNTANTANAAVAAATLAANNASTAAANAQTSANNAQTTANTANNAANSALAFIPKQSLFVKFSETKPKGTDAGASLLGQNTRVLNTTEYNGTNSGIVLNVVTGKITFGMGGYYHIEAESTIYDTVLNAHQLFVVDDVSNNNLLEGMSVTFNGASMNVRAKVCGLILVNNGQVIRLDHYTSHALASNGLGKASNVNPNAAGHEVYSNIIITPVSAA